MMFLGIVHHFSMSVKVVVLIRLMSVDVPMNVLLSEVINDLYPKADEHYSYG